MKTGKVEIVFIAENSREESSIRYEKVCRYLLQKFFEGCESNEGFGVSEGLDGGSGGERLFYSSTED